jgi:putative FmdB family regulatory protein
LPTYEYRCRNGHVFEVMQRMSDDPVAECEVCSEPVERVFHPVAVHFKGSGFYSTDYGRNRGGGGSDSGGGESGGGKDDSKKETTTSKTEGRSDGGSSSSGTSDSKSGSSSD